MTRTRGRRWFRGLVLLVIALTVVGGCAPTGADEPIRVGLLHSLTGPSAFDEKRMIDGEVLAIEEINRRGGVLGRTVEPVFADGESDAGAFADQAEQLITREHVSALFGTWASADRKSVVPVVERHRSVLFYPPAYEGLESSDSVVHVGPTPNQQTLPALSWLAENRGRRFFLLGSDEIWARSENEAIKDELALLGAEVVGEEYVPLHVHDTTPWAEQIAAARPDVIVNALSHGLVGFLAALRDAGVHPERTPTFSLALGEDLLRGMRPEEVTGGFVAWPYVQRVDSDENRAFVRRFQERYGAHRRTDDQIHNAYVAVHLWAAAVEKAGTSDPRAVLDSIRDLSVNAPGGRVWVDRKNRHVWRHARLGRINRDGQVDVVWVSEALIRPEPHPVSRTRREWATWQHSLYQEWGERWFRPQGT